MHVWSLCLTRIQRSLAGQALAEGVVALLLVVAGVVGGVILLVNVGMSTYYKEKLGFVANQVATYAATLSASNDITAKSTDLAKDLMTKMGLPSDATVTTETTTAGGKSAVSVTIQTGSLPLFGKGDILPLKISLRDTAVAIKGAGFSDFLVLGGSPDGNTFVTVPVVKKGNLGFANPGASSSVYSLQTVYPNDGTLTHILTNSVQSMPGATAGAFAP
ncbi:MAG: hypothetical protein HY711_06320 [Candidatus Melainabacteria bacterium]|nr:hypothetical protein [Candidatus Melainabacteria bacterium]